MKRLSFACIIGLASVSACGTVVTTALDTDEESKLTEISVESLESARDVLDSAGAGDASSGSPGALTASCPNPTCVSGTATCVASNPDVDTVVIHQHWAECVSARRPQFARDGNKTVTISKTGATWASRSITDTHSFTDSRVTEPRAGQQIVVSTTTPIVINSTGTKAGGTLTHVVASGVEHRERKGSIGDLMHSIDITYSGLQAVETYAGGSSKASTPTQAVLSGGQSVHHLLWKVTATNTATNLTYQRAACSCAPTSGTLEHRLVWDDNSRTVDMTRNWGACGTSTLTGSDSKSASKVTATITETCS